MRATPSAARTCGAQPMAAPILRMSATKTERLLNLVIALVNSPRYRSAAWIRDKVAGYSDAPNDEAFFRTFERDKELLQREQKSDVPGALVVLAYLTVLFIGVALYASMGWGLALLQRRLGAAAARA